MQPSKRVRISKHESLNLNNFSRTPNIVEKKNIESKNDKRDVRRKRTTAQKQDIEVAEILIDMKSDSNSYHNNSEEDFDDDEISTAGKKGKNEAKPKKPKQTARKPRTKKPKDGPILQSIVNENMQSSLSTESEEEKVEKDPEIFLCVFGITLMKSYLISISRRVTEMQNLTEDEILKVIQDGSEKYANENHAIMASEILVCGQILRYLLETERLIEFNLKQRAMAMFLKDAKKAIQCVKFVEKHATVKNVSDIDKEWTYCFEKSTEVLKLNDADKLRVYPIVQEVITERLLGGKHVKVYVAATLGSIFKVYSKFIDVKFEFGELWECLNPHFNISRVVLMDAINIISPKLSDISSVKILIES
jgi:hypothetical protein